MQDSFKKRYAYKLISNFLIFAMGLATAGIVPKSLGPKRYGDFAFLSNFFSQVLIFLELGTSNQFFARLSQEKENSKIPALYAIFIFFGFVGVGGYVIIMRVLHLHSSVWPNQSMKYICLAAGLTMLIRLIEIPNKMIDAYGYTVQAEIVKLIQKVLITICLITLSINSLLTYDSYFLYQYVSSMFLFSLLLWILIKNKHFIFGYKIPEKAEIIKICKDFYTVSSPMLTLSVVIMVTGIADRWLLQKYAGSTQQGFFGFSFNIAFFCSIFISSVTPLLMRDFAIASANEDGSSLKKPFEKMGPVLFFLGAYFTCFIAMQSKNICWLLGGDKYRDAQIPLTIMVFYPLMQVYGQMTGAFLTTTTRTKTFRNFSSFFCVLGLPITYLLIASHKYTGIALGATGLSIKTIAVDFVSVNILLYICCNIINTSFIRLFIFQLTTVGIMSFCAFILSRIFTMLISNNIIFQFIMAGIVYSIVGFLLIAFFPQAFGIHKETYLQVKTIILKKLKL